MNADEDLARRRFLIMNALRLSGVILALVGILAIAGKIDIPRIGAYALLIVGLFDVMIMPLILARNWRTPKP